MWQGIQDITNYRGCAATTEDLSAPLAEELNYFSARFETSQQQHSSASALLPPSPGSCTTPLTVEWWEHDVRQVLLAVNPKKAAGPDGVPGKVLRACAPQLTLIIFTRIFNLSLDKAVITSCLKSSHNHPSAGEVSHRQPK